MTDLCIGCGAPQPRELIDLGVQPPSNRYLAQPKELCNEFALRLGACESCGLVQLLHPMPPEMVRSHFDWITYNEPEGHLDDLVDALAVKGGLSIDTLTVGVTYKDDTTLARLERKALGKTYRLIQTSDLGIDDPLASLETIQRELTPDCAASLVERHGRADVVLVRHILEHAHQPRKFVSACQTLCKPGGFLVFEVPDCRKVLDGHDHCFLWEEHISYFTPETLRGFLAECGFNDIDLKVYPYPMEDSLVAIVRNGSSLTTRPVVDVGAEWTRIESFAKDIAVRGSHLRKYLKALKNQGKRVALFGAGHLAAKFVNFYGLADLLVGVIDDNPNKGGHFLPGSSLPIIGSTCMESGEIDLCLLTLNPESEQKVRKAKAGFLDRGGQFRSIFSASASSIWQDMEND